MEFALSIFTNKRSLYAVGYNAVLSMFSNFSTIVILESQSQKQIII